MLLNDEDQLTLAKWAKRHSYADNMFVSFVAWFNSKIYIDMGFHNKLDSIHIRVERKASWFSKWLFGPHDWKEVSLEEDGPWWDTIRKELPILIDNDKTDDLARELRRKAYVGTLAKEYNK